MGFPKPAEKNIELSGEDFKDTNDMEILTEEISKRIENQEDEISKFYKFFESFKQWIRRNKQGFRKPEDFRKVILERMSSLKAHINKTKEFLENILILTEGEQKLDSKKLMIKIDVGSDFDQEVVFAKRLKFPDQIIKIAKEVSANLRKSKVKVSKDLEVIKKTENLIRDIMNMTENINNSLKDFEDYIKTANDFSKVEQNLQILIAGIQNEKNAFEKLSKFEKIHLNLLLSLYEDEKNAIEVETRFAMDESKISK